MHAPHLRKFVANRLETALKSALYVFKVERLIVFTINLFVYVCFYGLINCVLLC